MRAAALLPLALVALASAAGAAAAPPSWLQRAAHQAGADLSDGSVPVSIMYVQPQARFPRVVLTGHFVCARCSHPAGVSAPTGSVAAFRFDGKTHETTDFALCNDRAGCDPDLLCSGGCTRVHDVLDVAFSALAKRLERAPDAAIPFSHKPGTFTCHIRYPVAEARYIVGRCTTAVRLRGKHAATVTFTERWRPRVYRRGRWLRLPTRTHVWRVDETNDGWQTRITSTGDAPPQLAQGRTALNEKRC